MKTKFPCSAVAGYKLKVAYVKHNALLCKVYEFHSNAVESLGPGYSTMIKPPESSKQKDNNSGDVLVF